MIVPSYGFLVFAAFVAAVLAISSGRRAKSLAWLLANLAFFATFARDLVEVLPFCGFLAVAYLSIRIVRVHKRKATFVALLAANIAVFCWLKRYVFIPPTSLLGFTYVTVGMSYVFFRIVHLLVDAFQDTLPGEVGPVAFANYALNFTSLVAGPIQLYGDYLRSQVSPAALDRRAVARALERILVGFCKVMIVSSAVGFAHDHAVTLALESSASTNMRVLFAGLAVGLFPISLYANFSGYTDVVIGVARFLRLELPENFDRPFTARGFIDFWGRWHMSLGVWVKTYIYSPLVIASMRGVRSPRVQPYLGVAAYFVAFFLVGIWHGQSAMFVVFGILLGTGVAGNKLFQIVLSRRLGGRRYDALVARPAFIALSRALTYSWFAFSSIWFWASFEQLTLANGMLGMFGSFATLALVFVVAVPALVLFAGVDANVRDLARRGADGTRGIAVRAAWYAMLATLLLSASVLQAPAPQIVYKGF